MSIYSKIVLYLYRTLKLITKEPATGQAVRLLILFILNDFATQSTSFISEPETTLPHEVIIIFRKIKSILNY